MTTGTLTFWFSDRSILLSWEKSTSTIFTPWAKEEVKNYRPKIIVVTFDKLLFFNHHAKNLLQSMKSLSNAEKAITGSNWRKALKLSQISMAMWMLIFLHRKKKTPQNVKIVSYGDDINHLGFSCADLNAYLTNLKARLTYRRTLELSPSKSTTWTC